VEGSIVSKLLVAGDWHGSTAAAQSCFEDAEREKCDAIIQVGDFGVTFGATRPVRFIVNVSNLASRWGIPVYFIDGNHENFNVIGDWVDNLDYDENGHIPVATNLTYIPRGAVWEWDDKTFAAMGGAASIDRDWRTEGHDYFKDELITTGDVYRLLNKVDVHGKRVDYFFSHDCSDRTPWGFSLVPDSDSQRNRQVVDGILDYVKPRMHFHGHMHKHYEWDNKGTMTFGLNLEQERHSRGVLNVSTGEFEYIPYRRPVDARQVL
jgi:predicted phosphodiesterase